MTTLVAQAGIKEITLRRAREKRCIADDRPPYYWTLRGETPSGVSGTAEKQEE